MKKDLDDYHNQLRLYKKCVHKPTKRYLNAMFWQCVISPNLRTIPNVE